MDKISSKKPSVEKKPRKKHKPHKPHKKRVDWEANQSVIRDAFMKLLKKYNRMPSSYEIAKQTGLSASSVQTHFKDMKFEPLNHQARALTNDVVLSIARSAQKGNSQAQKLWMQIMEGWSETTNQNVVTSTWKDALREAQKKIEADEKEEE